MVSPVSNANSSSAVSGGRRANLFKRVSELGANLAQNLESSLPTRRPQVVGVLLQDERRNLELPRLWVENLGELSLAVVTCPSSPSFPPILKR